MSSRVVIALIPFLSGMSVAAGQSCETVIRGYVSDEHDGQALEAATVFLEGAATGTYTEADGRFELTATYAATPGAPCGKTDTLYVDHIGCEPLRRAIVLDGSTQSVDIELEHHTELLSGIEVHGHRNQTSAADIGGTLSGEQLDASAGADLSTVAEALPGVRTLATGAGIGRPLVDGLGGSRLQIVQGGMALATQDWGDEHAPEVDPFAAASVQLARAGATVRYGAATTGATLVLDDALIPTEGSLTGQALALGATNAGLYGGGLAVAQRIAPHWGYRVQGFASSAADARAPDYVLSNTAQRRSSGQGRLYFTDSTLSFDIGYRYFGGESGVLRAAHVGNLTDLRRALATGEPTVIRERTRDIDAPRQLTGHHWVSADMAYALPGDRSVRLSYSTQVNHRREFDVRRGGRSATPSLDLSLTTHNVRAEYALEGERTWTRRIGLQGISAANRNRPGTGVTPFVPYYNASAVGAFAEQSRLTERHRLEFGARVDLRDAEAVYFGPGFDGQRRRISVERREWTGAASAGLVRYLDRGRSLRARLAYGSRTPNPAERFADGVHHALAVIERGDTSLTVEHGLKAVVGYGLETAAGAELHVSGFAQGFRGFIYARQLAEPALTIRGAFPVLEYAQADALLAGLDLDVHVPVSDFRLGLTANYLYGARAGGEALPDLAPLRTGLDVGYSRSLRRALKDWRVNLRGVYTAQQTQVPETLFAPAPGDFLLLHLEAGAHLAVGEHTLGVHLAARNLLDVAYRDYLDRLRFYADRPGRDVQLRLLYDF